MTNFVPIGKVGAPVRIRRLASRAALTALIAPLVLILLFRFLPVPLTPLMLVRLAQGYGLHHDWVAYDSVAPALAHAVVASEANPSESMHQQTRPEAVGQHGKAKMSEGREARAGTIDRPRGDAIGEREQDRHGWHVGGEEDADQPACLGLGQ